MILRIYAIAMGLGTLIAGFFVFSESPTLSPGPVSDVHEEFECRACHSPFQGTEEGCESCHGALPAANAHGDAGIGCGDCHMEHRADVRPIVGGAREQCGDCHEHASIEEVPAHAVGGTMKRLVDPQSPQRAEAEAFGAFSHEVHFEEAEVDDDPNCKTCHFVGVTAQATRGGEQLLRWSGCSGSGCHATWDEAGFPKVRARQMAVLELERFPRIAFSHSEEHLEVPCEDCHSGIRDAIEVGSGPGPAETTSADVASCFGCHVHQPQSVSWAMGESEVGDSEHAAGGTSACVDCHQFHGESPDVDFSEDPSSDPRPQTWDVLARGADLTFTPWLVLFLGLGSAGCFVVIRRLPEQRTRDLAANPDVAPQRVPEVPVLSPFFETSVSGLYIIGELAGVPLVNRAMKSGFDVVDFIANRLGGGGGQQEGEDVEPEERLLDLVIVGSGPAGLGAATRAQSVGLSYVVCEKSTAAATIRDYPRAKVIQAAPVDIPDYGSFFQEDDESKEALVRRWGDIITRTGVVMREREEVVGIENHADGGFVVETQGGKAYRTQNVVLAIGTRGTPRRIGIDGEEPERVFYNLIDAEEYREQDILVVGGGNAAVEAALALSQPELLNRVTLAHRGPVLKGITPQNSSDIDAAAAEGQLKTIPSSKIEEIRPSSVLVGTPDEPEEVPNEVIFALIGAELPIGFLKKIGVKMAKKGGL